MLFNCNLISFLLLATCLLAISDAAVINCEAPITETCMVISSDPINSIEEPLEIVGAEHSIPFLSSVTGFYALHPKDVKIKFIPSNIFKIMPNIEYFYLHNVDLEELPTDSFKKCSKVNQISLQENKLRALGQGFAMGCSNASVLDLSYNQLTELNGNFFKGLSTLTALNINYNLIEVITKGTFDNMPALSLISLDMNKISFVHPTAFTSLPSLTALVLSNNYIKVIKSGWFVNKTYFERVNLKNNRIVAVDPKIFETWMVTNSNDTKAIISYDLNLEANVCIDMELKRITEITAPYFKHSLNRCFAEYEADYFYKNFPLN